MHGLHHEDAQQPIAFLYRDSQKRFVALFARSQNVVIVGVAGRIFHRHHLARARNAAREPARDGHAIAEGEGMQSVRGDEHELGALGVVLVEAAHVDLEVGGELGDYALEHGRNGGVGCHDAVTYCNARAEGGLRWGVSGWRPET